MAGRKPKYKKNFPALAREFAALGASSTRQLAKRLGDVSKADIAPSTVHGWRREYPEFDAAIHEGMQVYLRDVGLPALVKLARGYNYTEATYQAFQTMDNEGNVTGVGKPVLMRKVRKHMAPNSGAVQLALAIADERLNPKKKVESSGEVVMRHGMTDEAAALLDGLYGGKVAAPHHTGDAHEHD